MCYWRVLPSGVSQLFSVSWPAGPVSWTGAAHRRVHSSTEAGDTQILGIESLPVVGESSCLSGLACCWSSPCGCLHRVRPRIPGHRVKFYQMCWQCQPSLAPSRRMPERASEALCLGRALCVPSLWVRYLCCRGLHRSSSFLCSILWHALSNGEPTYSQPQESLTKRRTLWIWWLRISCPCSGCLQVQKMFHC